MTPQEQKNRLNDIMFHAQRCELYDDEHRLYAKMGLGITIYFYGGGSESGQRKVLEVFKRYQEQYSKYLNGLFFEEHQRFVKFSAAQFEKSMEKSQKTAQRDERLEAHISSERKSDYAPDYHCSTLTTSPTGEFEYNLLSYLSLTFPIGWLKDETRRQEFEEPEYEGRGIGPGGQNRQNRADTGGKRRNRPCAVRRRMAAVQP